jgi:SWI/SNF-related matrix-associated actin-dependent regulator of chromatin subfamily A-like protein 1
MKIITKQSGTATIFVAESSYAEKDIPKAAGFCFCWGKASGKCWKGCLACAAGVSKAWYTDKPELASRLGAFADQATAAHLAPAAAAIEASKAHTSNFEVPCPTGLAYRPFQKAGIAYMADKLKTMKGVVNGDDMGLGKTIQTAGLINASPEISTVLMICPQHLRINWKREAEKWLTRSFEVYIVQNVNEPIPASATFVVVNYDKLAGKNASKLIPYLMLRDWDLLVADEAQYLKNPKAQRTRAVLGDSGVVSGMVVPGLISKAKKFLALTGTPIENCPAEFQPVLTACAPEVFPFWSYMRRYAGATKGPHGWDFSGATNLEELQVRLRATCMVRRRQEDVLTELPPMVRQVVPLDGSALRGAIDREREAYDEYEATHSAVAFEELSHARREVGEAKVPMVITHVQDMLDSGVQKVVIFAYHHTVLDAIAEAFEGCVTFNGTTSAANKDAAVEAFQNNPNVRVFVGQIKAAGTGITLTASNREVFAELDYNPAIISQAEKRCQRIGQRSSVLAQHLVYEGSLDDRMLEIIISKQEIADKALDGKGIDFVAKVAEVNQVQAAIARVQSKVGGTVGISSVQKVAAKRAMQILAGMCDGALLKDGAGFNKLDASFGRSLAMQEREFSDKQFLCAKRMAKFYRRQLPDDVLAGIAGNGLDAVFQWLGA